MTSDVVLSAALRNNLSSLANTQTQIDKTQLALSTGKKVNSALDNPQEFFQAQALNDSASDLTNLLDSFSNSIQTVNAANNGITSLTGLVNQAQSIAQTAQTDAANGASVASVTGNTNLKGISDLTQLAGLNGGDTYKLVLSQTDSTGATVDLGSYGAGSGSGTIHLGATAAITISADTSTQDLINTINGLNTTNNASTASATGGAAFTASLDSSGHLQITSANGNSFTLKFEDTSTSSDATNSGVASALGFAGIAGLDGDGTGTNVEKLTASSSSALSSHAFYVTNSSGKQVVASASDTLDNLVDSTGATNYFATLDDLANSGAGGDNLTISINGGSSQSIALEDSATSPVSIQNVIDSINNNSSLNTQVKASFDATTGSISLAALNSNVKTIQFGSNNAAAANSIDFGFGGTGALTTDGTGSGDGQATVVLGQANGALQTDQENYTNILSQIDQLTQDTGYQGVNLLKGDNLTTYFDAGRTTSSTINGTDFTSSGLGITAADFSSADSVTTSINQLQNALTTIRGYGSSLADGLSVIQNRQTFTNSTISTLQTGANNLVDADSNTESANLLALQTQQSLGVDALSLASQSAQSVLKLFG